MNTEITHNGITINLEMYEVPTELKGRGWIHPATLRTSCSGPDLQKLIGLELWGEKVQAVESFASMQQPAGRMIGLLMSKQLWSGK